MMGAPREGRLVKVEPETPSPEAMAFARSYDKLDRHGQEVLRAVLRVEEKRCEDQRRFQSYTCDLPEN